MSGARLPATTPTIQGADAPNPANHPQRVPHHAHAAAMLDALAEPVLLLDERGTILATNSAAEPALMLSRNRLVGQPLTGFCMEPATLAKAIQHCWLHERPSEPLPILLKPRNQPPHPIRLSLRPVLDAAAHRTEGVLAILHTAPTLAQPAESHTDSAAYMAAVLAHEIKNPLAGIRGAAQLVAAAVPDAMQKMVQLIINEVDRIRGLVEHMEVFNQPRPLPTDAVNIHEVLHHALLLAKPCAPPTLEVREQFDPSLPAIHAPHHALVQMLLNLIKNAIEAMEATPAPILTLSTDYWRDTPLGTPCVRLRIADNGPGIPETLQPSIFEPFVSTKSGGKGLGLAVVAKLAQDGGIRLQLAESYAGHTCFELLLPVAK